MLQQPRRYSRLPIRNSKFKMTDKKLKHVCPECKVNKWIVDFKEGCYAELTRHSICLFCEKGKEIETLRKENMEMKKENMEMKKKMQEMYALIEDLQKNSKVLNNEVIDNGKDIYEIRKQLAAAKSTSKIQTEEKEERPNPRRNREEQFIKATGRRVTARKSKVQHRDVETATWNRFSLLAEEEEETVLIGDSMVKNQGRHFGLKNKYKRKVRSYPGANAKELEEVIGKMRVENKKTNVIIQASGNDLFQRNGNAGPTEPLIKQLDKTVKSVKKKTNNAIVIGILPRLDVSHFALSKAIGLNDRLKSLCQQNAVRFIDLWDTFYGKRKLFKKDGIHFNEEGMKAFGNQLNLELYNNLRNPIDTGHTELPENTSNTNGGNTVNSVTRTHQPQGNE